MQRVAELRYIQRPEQNETSIALVPRNHPLLPLPNLEAEASGLLDRLLNVFHENIRSVAPRGGSWTLLTTDHSDPILIDATLNCMSILIRTRAAVAHKIISAVLNFNPLKPANAPMKPKLRVIVKSMERTTRAFLKNINKHNPQGQLAAKIDAYIARLTQSRATIFSEAQSLKRPAPTDTPDGCGGPKRTRLAAGPTKYPHMPPPPNSFAHFFTLTEDAGLIAFDVKVLPVDMINAITALTLQHVDQQAMDEAIGAIRARYAHLQKMQQPTPVPDIPMAGPTGVDDEDDYDPEYDPGNEAAMTPASAQVVEELIQPELALGPFQLPKPSPLTEAEIALLSQQTVDRVFSMVTSLDLIPQTMSRQKLGLNRLAASTNDRDAWFTMMTRLATRAPSGLDDLIASELDSDDENTESITVKLKSERHDSYTNIDKPSLANGIRNTLYRYVLEDFRPRLNIAISWLNEEWYSDRLRLDAHPSLTSTESNPASNLPNYYNWTYHLLDTLLPYLDARDNKILIRFLSEIPAIDAGILDRVKSLARDPERISMCMMALQYLIMFRPPVRPLVIDTVQSIAQDEEYKEAKPQASKILGKWRPAVLAENVTPAQAMMEREGKGKEKKLGKMEQGVVDALVAENHSATTLTIDPRRRDAGNSPAQASA